MLALPAKVHEIKGMMSNGSDLGKPNETILQDGSKSIRTAKITKTTKDYVYSSRFSRFNPSSGPSFRRTSKTTAPPPGFFRSWPISQGKCATSIGKILLVFVGACRYGTLLIRKASCHRNVLLWALIMPCGNAIGQALQPDPGRVLEKLRQSADGAPWLRQTGYRLTGDFFHKALGEAITYKAAYLRLPDRWVADFQPDDPTRGMRCGSGIQSWISTPEATADVKPAQLPLCARYDYPLLYMELERILKEGPAGPQFKIGSDEEGVYVRGKLSDGYEATFALSPVDNLPRKVSIVLGPQAAAPAWSFVIREPDGSTGRIHAPELLAERFEIWLSEPVQSGNYRYPRRADYVVSGVVAGTFFTEAFGPASPSDPLLERPERVPWLKDAMFKPGEAADRPSIFLPPGRAASFRARLGLAPWNSWARDNAITAYWSAAAFWIPRVIPSPSTPTLIGVVQLLLLIAIAILIWRRRKKYGQPVSKKYLAGWLIVWTLVFASGTATVQAGRAPIRGLLALHSAIRFASTGNSIHARTAGRYLRSIPVAAPAGSAFELSQACQSYSVAYDLIRPALAPGRRAEIEEILANYARPLYGALRGWRANTGIVHNLAAGLGLTGLAIGSRKYAAAAQAGLRKGLDEQFHGGLHREGPGVAAEAMDSAINLAFALKLAGREDFYSHPVFRQYVGATLNLTSPLGTLPLFGALSLDQSRHVVPFWLKAAGSQPGETARQCIAAYNTYWNYGRYSVHGAARLYVHWAQPYLSFFYNPHVLFQYQKTIVPSQLPAASAVEGNGQVAVLRTGAGPDDLYIALNMIQSPPWFMNGATLAFDFAGWGGLLLHGPGRAAAGRWDKPLTVQTRDFNSITFEDRNQSAAESTGVAASMINQPLFDYVRVFADRAYEQGQVQRDVILVRGRQTQPPYAVLIDEVHATDPKTSVQWYLHGAGELSRGIDQSAKLIAKAFRPPALRSENIEMSVLPVGFAGLVQSEKGRLRYESSFLDHDVESLVLEWTGSQRFFTVLAPHKAKTPEIKMEPVAGGASVRLGAMDWLSLGDLETRRSLGPFRYAAEFCLAREAGERFPALLLISGIEFSGGPHSFASDKPVSLSLEGLEGTLLNPRPDTKVEIRSPSLRSGEEFFLDGVPVPVMDDHRLVLSLTGRGEHRLNRRK